jgi:hypothetical protein
MIIILYNIDTLLFVKIKSYIFRKFPVAGY